MTYTTTTRRGANHGLHLFLSIITMGLWAVTGWPIAAMIGRKQTVRYDGGGELVLGPDGYQMHHHDAGKADLPYWGAR